LNDHTDVIYWKIVGSYQCT